MSRSASRASALSRRAVLASGTAAGVLAATPQLRAQARAGAHTFKLGAAEVTVLTDGSMAMPLGWVLPGRERAEVEAAFKDDGRTLGELTIEVNVALVRTGGQLILIDAGSGPDFAPQRGKLADNLAAAGIKPEAITTVVFTHAHPDHLWGVIDPLDDSTLFPKARHVMTAAERDYWLKPGVEASVPEAVRGAAIGTQRRLKTLGDRIETVRPGAEISAGVTLVDTAGHSPGHVSVLVRSGGEQLLIGGDVLIEHTVSFARPEWRWGPDWDQDMAVAARRRTLDMLATDRVPLLGYHLPWPGLGRVERKGAAWRFARG